MSLGGPAASLGLLSTLWASLNAILYDSLSQANNACSTLGRLVPGYSDEGCTATIAVALESHRWGPGQLVLSGFGIAVLCLLFFLLGRWSVSSRAPAIVPRVTCEVCLARAQVPHPSSYYRAEPEPAPAKSKRGIAVRVSAASLSEDSWRSW